MPIYTSSKGEEKDTALMPYTYLQNALRKAEENGDDINAEALREEIALRDSDTENVNQPETDDGE